MLFFAALFGCLSTNLKYAEIRQKLAIDKRIRARHCSVKRSEKALAETPGRTHARS